MQKLHFSNQVRYFGSMKPIVQSMKKSAAFKGGKKAKQRYTV